jgi:hypothetical protein
LVFWCCSIEELEKAAHEARTGKGRVVGGVWKVFAPVEAIFVERAEHSVLLVDGVEERADMISPSEVDPGELY